MATEGQMTNTNTSGFTDNQTGPNNGQGNKATQKGYETYDQARQKTGEVVEQVQEKAGEVVDQIKEQAATQLSSQKDRIVDGIENVALMLRMSGDQLRQSDQEGIAQYTDQAASRIEDISNFLRDRELGDIVTEVENFARREPVLFLGGAFTVGLLAARFLKSSAPSSRANQNTNALARRQGDGTRAATTAPLTPRPVTGRSQGSYDTSYSTTANTGQKPTSTVAQHFGEASAVGANQSVKVRDQEQGRPAEKLDLDSI